jgi:hypothetical protein
VGRLKKDLHAWFFSRDLVMLDASLRPASTS